MTGESFSGGVILTYDTGSAMTMRSLSASPNATWPVRDGKNIRLLASSSGWKRYSMSAMVLYSQVDLFAS